MESAGIYARRSSYLDCIVQIGVASQQIVSVSFPASVEEDVPESHDVLDTIFAYLEGVTVDFTTIDVALTVPTDQRSVLETTREIPYGEQVSVEQLIRMTPSLDPEDEESNSIARTALAENPVPIIIPDHRVRDGPSALPADVEQKVRQIENL
ncbi:MAG: MGMT family protein [Halodesulfurarchaeum sp.]